MNKKWVLREKISDDLEKQILFWRGIKTEDEAEKFLNPDYERDLADPYLFAETEKIVSRVVKAVEDNEKIIIFGDYDADGICSCVIMRDFLKKIGFENFEVYIPDRNREGYGLNLSAVEEFINKKVNLIITFDCGITDLKEVEKARDAGIDVIIIDHHLPPEELPPAFAILDPKMEREDYPFKDFCGAGLAFKFVSALVKNESFKIAPGWEKWLLDAAAIATVADMFSILGESRVLVYFGLEVLRKTRRPGLISLFQKLKIDKSSITEDDIGFLIAPCINVASRFDHAAISYYLLTTDSREEAESLSQKLIDINAERKKISEEIFQRIDKQLSQISSLPEIIVLGDESWELGVLSILANKVLDKYNKPVMIWGKRTKDGKRKTDNELRGSCRSNGTINFVDLLSEIGNKVFTEYGGHAVAAGFSLKENKLDDLNREVKNACQKISHYKAEPLNLWLDAELDLENIDWNFLEFLERFRPFGTGNPKPVFFLKNIEVWNVRTFGNTGLHLEISFRKNSGETIRAIGFFMARRFDFEIDKGVKIDLAASIEKNSWNGSVELRMRIVDIREAQKV